MTRAGRKTDKKPKPSRQKAADHSEAVVRMEKFPIVGIGASAGGLEALELFLSHVPNGSGMAFIIVQHLSPDHSGNLPELLQRQTTMKVSQAGECTIVEPDHVYTIPPNKDLRISNRTLHLHDPVEKHGLRLPIDSFLVSLAEDCGDQSIGVILSGMGSDGTLGMKAVREHDGLTLAQEPSEAKFNSMPKSIIDAGLADIVDSADALPARIIDFLGSAVSCSRNERRLDEDRSSFGRIITLLRSKTRHDFSLYKQASILRRVERRMAIHRIAAIGDYARFLKKNPAEIDLLFKELLIGVTSFFRDAAMWDSLKYEALPKLLAAYPKGGTLRAWSCGCSTGEEAYSLAMVFLEALDRIETAADFSLQIFATDLDSDAIDKARKGIFSSRIEADVSSERLLRFFVKEDKGYRVSRVIREMVTFARQNVAMDPPFTKLDILICRNLLIYLSPELQKKLLPLFHYSLKPGGLLFLGSAETIGSQTELFTAAGSGTKQYWRSQATPQTGMLTFPTSLTTSYSPPLHQEPYMFNTAENLQQLADNLILQNFSSPTVLATEHGDIVYISGRTGRYLEPAAGKANMNIFAMIREEFRYQLGAAFSQALRQSEPVTVRVEPGGTDNGLKAVDMTLMKIENPEAVRGMLMISFRELTLPSRARRRKTGSPLDSKLVEEQELTRLREELRTLREEMQSAHEELKSTNEELQSTNEELQSANEELTTSKEEMQSMNEELQTVNAEQSARLDDLMQINNDMENLLNSTEIVTIFLDNHLQVRRFTTGANRLFKLIPGDVGRPLTDIVSNLDYPRLYDDVQDVLRKLISVENQVPSLDGRWYLLRIMPYRTMEKKIDGVVLTCNDITVAKQLEDELRKQIVQLGG